MLMIKNKSKHILNYDYHYYNDKLEGVYLATEYVFICDGYITMKKGYAWNGCTIFQGVANDGITLTPVLSYFNTNLNAMQYVDPTE